MVLRLVVMSAAVLFLLLFVRLFARKPGARKHSRPNPDRKKPNDKIVLIKGAALEDIKVAVKQFCTLYNNEERLAVIQVNEAGNRDIVLTFPYNIGFGNFCFLVNYLYYPNKLKYEAQISGWATAIVGDMWVNDVVAGKKVMLYIPEGNEEYDCVYMVTESNAGYKISFTDSGEPLVIEAPQQFVAEHMQPNEVSTKGEEIY